MRILCLAPLLFLSGCTLPAYEQPISEMNAALSAAVTSIEAIDTRMTKILNERRTADVTAGRALLETKAGTCTLGADSCSLQVLYLAEGESFDYPLPSLMPNARKPLAALRSYVSNLQAIVDADTASAISTHANAAIGSIGSIHSILSPDAEVPIKDYVLPASNLFSWAAGQYVTYVKASALADATRQAQPVIDRLAAFYDGQLDAVTSYSVGEASMVFIPRQEAFDDLAPGSAGPSAISAYAKAAVAYDQALRATSINPVRTFAAAHRSLSEQLNNKDGSFAPSFASINQLKVEAKALKDILDAFEAVSSSE